MFVRPKTTRQYGELIHSEQVHHAMAETRGTKRTMNEASFAEAIQTPTGKSIATETPRATKLPHRQVNKQCSEPDSLKNNAIAPDRFTIGGAAKKGGNEIQTNPSNKEHYCISRKIGEGSFGIVYDGIRPSDGKQIAIKFVSIAASGPKFIS